MGRKSFKREGRRDSIRSHKENGKAFYITLSILGYSSSGGYGHTFTIPVMGWGHGLGETGLLGVYITNFCLLYRHLAMQGPLISGDPSSC